MAYKKSEEKREIILNAALRIFSHIAKESFGFKKANYIQALEWGTCVFAYNSAFN